MSDKFTFTVNEENVFKHICTNIPFDRWEEIKEMYHLQRKHDIDGFTPVVFSEIDLNNRFRWNKIKHILLEGRKYNKIAVICCRKGNTLVQLRHRIGKYQELNIPEHCTFLIE